ncbi:hypothetical protein VOLCADRAFT_103076 [Volvox carteri f. nagariensis]|uniref:EamA domain-containing protein n=1 Tax=Volvox carteri f. nagariensis TaxID=3068 RepID=D8TJR4_VOLCA|nr:uncharacterized protein VOLCADRAFT_103076 [Volvox carteri f. nagariensis]EFJ52587.1 hypothetical protein VOLCADRAFT_103076 [Volvox carteri f. nagariensis]|eukprot:XP_002946660.1 hypothetical protein VOLCADRAFT_103076 [Volvox carteri f. nagariensis]
MPWDNGFASHCFGRQVIALLLDWLLMGRSPGRGGAAATTLTLAGALLVTQPPFLFGDHTKPQPHHGAAAAVAASGDGNVGGGSDGTDGGLSSVGVALALLAAAANASGFLTINLLRGQQHPLVLTWWYNLVLAVVTAAPLALRWPRAPVPPPGRREALLLVAVGTTQLAAQLCLNRGFQLEPPGRGAAINVLQVLFSFILDVAVLGNKPSLLSVGGSSLVAAGVLFVAMSSPSKRASDNKHGHKLGGGEAATVEPVTPSGDREAGAGGQGDGRRVEADAVAVVVTGPRVGDSELRAPLLSADPEPDDACTSLTVKLLGDEVPTFQVVFVPGLICFLATSVAVKLNGLNVRSKSWRIAGLTLLRGALGATSITCFYLAIEVLPLQDAVTLFFCSPVVACLLEFAVTGESQGWACAAATVCTVAGVVLVAQPPCIFSHHEQHHTHQHHHQNQGGGGDAGSGGGSGGSGGDGAPSGFVQGLLGGSGTYPAVASSFPMGSGSETIAAGGAALATVAAITNAAAFVVIRVLRRSQSTLVLTWWYHGVVVVFSATALTLGYPASPVLPTRRGCGLLVVVGLTQLLGQLLLNRGFQLESATRGSAINVLQVLFSFVWDVAVLGDQPALVSVAGSSLVAAGVVFMALTAT